MLNKLKKILGSMGPRKMTHPVFGELLFMKMRDPDKSYWEGEVTVEDHPNPISLGITAPEDGPQAAHEQFWQNIIDDFDAVIAKCQPILKDEYEAWTEKTYPENFFSEFTWEGLSIPQDGDEQKEWDISFTCASDSEHLFTIYFEDGKAAYATIDG